MAVPIAVADAFKLDAMPSMDTCSDEKLKIIRICAITMISIGCHGARVSSAIGIPHLFRGLFAVPDGPLVPRLGPARAEAERELDQQPRAEPRAARATPQAARVAPCRAADVD